MEESMQCSPEGDTSVNNSAAASGIKDDDDPVVHEIPVYAAQSLAKSLFLFQYPLQASTRAHMKECPMAARFKPIQKRVQLDVPLQTNRSTYDRHKGSVIAEACDGEAAMTPGDPKEKVFDSDFMDKQTLSSAVAATQKRYAIGMLRGGELHLTPVCAAVQLRPSFHYLDKGDLAKTGKGGKHGEDGEEEEAEDEKKGKTVTVRFARPESEQAKAARLASYKHFEEESAKEKWVDVPVYPETTELAQVEREFLYSSNTGDHVVQPFDTITPAEYLKKLCPDAVSTVDTNPSHPNDILSMTQLKKMPFREQVRALLINAKVIQFTQLISLLDASTQAKEVLELLPQFAWLVRGCWVVKSGLLYPENTCSAHSGIAAEILCKARDYTVWRFTQSRFVKRQDVTSVIKVPVADLDQIFNPLARIGKREGWEFCSEDGNEFIAKHPAVYQQQQEVWTAEYARLAKELNIEGRMGGRIPTSTSQENIGGRKRKKSFSSQTSVPVAAAVAVKNEPVDCSTTMAAAEPLPPAAAVTASAAVTGASVQQQQPVAEAAPAVRIKPEPMDTETSAVEAAASSVSTPPPAAAAATGGVQAPPLVSLVRRVLSTGVQTWRNIRKVAFTEQTTNPALAEVVVTDQALSKALIVAEAVELPASSETPTMDDRLYALGAAGDAATDPYRRIVLTLFAAQSSVSRRIINEAITKSVDVVDSKAITRLLKDLCMKQGTNWVIRRARI